MDAQLPEQVTESANEVGLILRNKVFQGTFEFTVSVSVQSGVVSGNSENAREAVFYRPLPLLSVWRILVVGFLVAAISAFVWQGWLPDLSVSQLSALQQGQLWRTLTAQFQHADSRHLLNNLLPFIGVGWLLWGYFGAFAFPVVPVAIGTLANFVAILTYPAHINIVGISGTVFSMAGLWAMLYIKNDVRYSVPKRFVRALGFLLILFFPLSLEERVADRVHLLGALFGLLFGYIGWGNIRAQRVSNPKSSARMVRVL